jgi:hypothetical protein
MLNMFWTFVLVYAVANPMIGKQNKVANLLNILFKNFDVHKSDDF